MADVVIRAAEFDDWPVLVEFNRRLALETEGRHLDAGRLTLGVQSALRDASKARYFVAVADNEAVGRLMHTWEWSDWRNGMLWWLQSVYVLPEYRRRGVFRNLWQHVRDLAAADPGVAGLRLYVEHDNQTARAVYERLGMEPAGYEVLEMMWAR